MKFMGRYDALIEKLVQWGGGAAPLLGALVIGSQARADHPADEFSDLDLVLVVEDPSYFLQSDEWLLPVGMPQISFIESTVSGALERRVLFAGGLDVDFVILSRDAFRQAAAGGLEILGRGYRILLDKIGLGAFLPPISPARQPYILLSQQQFDNLVNDFWYHAVWSAKKCARGELRTAKGCVDGHMKHLLRQLVECHSHALHGPAYDTWHDGRFLAEWAEGWVVQALPLCYAHFETDDMKRALLETMRLFHRVAVDTAERLHYEYPHRVHRAATGWVRQALNP